MNINYGFAPEVKEAWNALTDEQKGSLEKEWKKVTEEWGNKDDPPKDVLEILIDYINMNGLIYVNGKKTTEENIKALTYHDFFNIITI